MVLTGDTYVVARTASGRPACQHKISLQDKDVTRCGHNMSQWSRQYTKERLDAILCKQKACHE